MCCQSDGLKPLGILTDKDAASSADALIGGESKQQLYSQVIVLRHEENSNSSTAFNRTVTTVSSANNILEPTVIETDIDEAIIPLKTQLMRLHWEEIIPKPPVPKAASKRMMKSSSVVTEELGNVADSEYGFLFSEIQSWRDLADDSSDGVISSSSTCSLSEALSALLGSPLVIALHKIKSRIVDEAADDDNGDLSDPRMTIHMQSAYSLICNKVDCGKSC